MQIFDRTVLTPRRLLTLDEAAEVAGRSRRTIERAIERGELPSLRVGGGRGYPRVDPAHLELYTTPRPTNPPGRRPRPRRSVTDKGFTLIELLVVVIIIGILAAIAIPVFMNQKSKAHDASVRSDVNAIVKGIETAGADGDTGTITGTSGTVTVGAASAPVLVTDGTDWSVKGSNLGYCVKAWRTDGRYSEASPLVFSSLAGTAAQAVPCTPVAAPTSGGGAGGGGGSGGGTGGTGGGDGSTGGTGTGGGTGGTGGGDGGTGTGGDLGTPVVTVSAARTTQTTGVTCVDVSATTTSALWQSWAAVIDVADVDGWPSPATTPVLSGGALTWNAATGRALVSSQPSTMVSSSQARTASLCARHAPDGAWRVSATSSGVTCAMDQQWVLFCWGANAAGQITGTAGVAIPESDALAVQGTPTGWQPPSLSVYVNAVPTAPAQSWVTIQGQKSATEWTWVTAKVGGARGLAAEVS